MTDTQDAGQKTQPQTPSGWDYVDAAFDAIPPAVTAAVITYAAVSFTHGTDLTGVYAVAGIVGLAQVHSYLRDIYTGARRTVGI